MKETAVEYLIEQLSNYDSEMIKLFENEITQAKEMEKQQIFDAYQQGFNNAYFNNPLSKEQYYNETFNK